MNELAELQEKVKQQHEKVLSKLRELYHYAREKGFTSSEARILSRTNKLTIDRIAEQREK